MHKIENEIKILCIAYYDILLMLVQFFFLYIQSNWSKFMKSNKKVWLLEKT